MQVIDTASLSVAHLPSLGRDPSIPWRSLYFAIPELGSAMVTGPTLASFQVPRAYSASRKRAPMSVVPFGPRSDAT